MFLKALPHSTAVPSVARVARRMARRSSSGVGSSSWTYFSMSSGSWSASFSNRSWRACAAASRRSAGISTVSHSSPMPLSSAQCSAFMSMRSMTPMKLCSEPQGSCRTRAGMPRRSSIMPTVRAKSAPVRSILFTKQIRGTW